MERRDDDLDAVVLHDSHAVEQVLLRREAAGGRARRRAAELVDELVDPGGGERGAGAAREELPPGQAHQEGWTRRSAPSILSMFWTIRGSVCGGAMCSLSVYSEPLYVQA